MFTIQLVNNWLKGWVQRVVVNGVICGWWPVTSSVPQGSVEGFYVFISYLDIEVEGTLNKFASNTKLGGGIDCLKVREALQRERAID